jgi:hypothetical protein
MKLAPAAMEAAPVYPAFIDKLRVVVRKKLGWTPSEARSFFAPFKPAAKAGTLTVGALLAAINDTAGLEAAVTVARELAWLGSEEQIKRERRRTFKGRT